MTRADVVVAGGGMVGSAAAIALSKLGNYFSLLLSYASTSVQLATL